MAKKERKETNTATPVGQNNSSQEALYSPRQTLTSRTLFQVFFKLYHLVFHQYLNEDLVVGLAKCELTLLSLIKCSTVALGFSVGQWEVSSTTSPLCRHRRNKLATVSADITSLYELYIDIANTFF